MTAPSDSARCAFVGCKLPRLMGQVWCVEHKPKPLTFKEGIAAGPKFEAARDDSDEKGTLGCPACDEVAVFDKRTGLCRKCWRAWRFSTERKS